MIDRTCAARAARALRDEPHALAGAARFAPLIDVVFLLLLYFLLAAQFRSEERYFQVDLPAARAAGELADPFTLPERPISVLVESTPAGPRLRTDSPLLPDAPTPVALTRALRDARGLDLATDQRFLIRADPGAQWEHALDALNAVLRAGYDTVRFAEATP